LTRVHQIVINNARSFFVFEQGRHMKFRNALAALLMTVGGSAYATEYLQNGSFETGAFDGWTLADPLGLTFVQPTTFGYGAEDGKFYVYAAPPTSFPGSLSQTFSDTPGELLNITGWAIGDTSVDDGLGDISYFFDGVLLPSPDLSSGAWTQSNFHVVATGSDTFAIEYANDGSANGLDNFSVTGIGSAVPEPSSWVMSLIGFVGLGLLARTGRTVLSRPA
jgi:hypothetical protein